MPGIHLFIPTSNRQKTEDKFHVVLSLTNGGANYGPSTSYKNDRKNLYAIIGASDTNPLIDDYFLEIKDKADVLFNINADKLTAQGYNKSYMHKIVRFINDLK